jgi:tetratricopeptide (TPR) repeat protein
MSITIHRTVERNKKKIELHQGEGLLNMILYRILFFTILIGTPICAQNAQTLFSQANGLYQNEKFEEAAVRYQQILSQGFESKEVYYNLGNCYYRIEDIGQAVLYYEKALRLDPDDSDILYNLELANLKVLDRVELPPRFFLFDWWDSILNYYSIPQITHLVAILFALTLFLLGLWLFLKRDRLRFWALTAVVVTGLFTIFWSFVLINQARSYINHRYAVVLVSTITVMSAPDESSTDVFILHEGVKVYLDELREEWVKISLPDGKSGWLLASNLGII